MYEEIKYWKAEVTPARGNMTWSELYNHRPTPGRIVSDIEVALILARSEEQLVEVDHLQRCMEIMMKADHTDAVSGDWEASCTATFASVPVGKIVIKEHTLILQDNNPLRG